MGEHRVLQVSSEGKCRRLKFISEFFEGLHEFAVTLPEGSANGIYFVVFEVDSKPISNVKVCFSR